MDRLPCAAVQGLLTQTSQANDGQQRDMDIDLQHVPCWGAAQALTDMIGGRVDIHIESIG
jgi:tripartite-type tricarboxylate transporter receptor subunit TctC